MRHVFYSREDTVAPQKYPSRMLRVFMRAKHEGLFFKFPVRVRFLNLKFSEILNLTLSLPPFLWQCSLSFSDFPGFDLLFYNTYAFFESRFSWGSCHTSVRPVYWSTRHGMHQNLARWLCRCLRVRMVNTLVGPPVICAILYVCREWIVNKKERGLCVIVRLPFLCKEDGFGNGSCSCCCSCNGCVFLTSLVANGNSSPPDAFVSSLLASFSIWPSDRQSLWDRSWPQRPEHRLSSALSPPRFPSSLPHGLLLTAPCVLVPACDAFPTSVIQALCSPPERFSAVHLRHLWKHLLSKPWGFTDDRRQSLASAILEWTNETPMKRVG